MSKKSRQCSKSDLLSKTGQDFLDQMHYLIYLSEEYLLPVGLHVLLDGGKLLEPVAVRFQVWELLYSNLDKKRNRDRKRERDRDPYVKKMKKLKLILRDKHEKKKNNKRENKDIDIEN